VLIRSADPRIVEALTSRYRVIARQVASSASGAAPTALTAPKSVAVPGG
jgi:hypothetical protein